MSTYSDKYPRYCHSCCNWEYVYNIERERFGKCNEPLVQEKLKVTEIHDNYLFDNEAIVFTAGSFGCPFHQIDDTPLSVASLPSIEP